MKCEYWPEMGQRLRCIVLFCAQRVIFFDLTIILFALNPFLAASILCSNNFKVSLYSLLSLCYLQKS